jgi:tRNA-dihydrouridine synthase B
MSVQPKTQAAWRIGGLEFAHPFFLAPMAGLTSLAMRRLAREYGAAMCYSEMMLAGFVTKGNDQDDRYPRPREFDRPVGVQLCGKDPALMAEAARCVDDQGFDLVDINMACPVKKVGKKGYGGFLLREPELALRLIDAVRRVVHRPLTIKIRAGFHEGDDGYLDLSRRAVDAGVEAIAVHGRTVTQKYRGQADWTRIKALVDAVDVPVVGSGDVFTGAEAVRMHRETGCAGVMCARGAVGSPWIFRDALSLFRTGEPAPEPTREETVDVMRRHFEMLREYTSQGRAIRIMRRSSVYYSRKLHMGPRLRERLVKAVTPEAFHSALDDYAASE